MTDAEDLDWVWRRRQEGRKRRGDLGLPFGIELGVVAVDGLDGLLHGPHQAPVRRGRRGRHVAQLPSRLHPAIPFPSPFGGWGAHGEVGNVEADVVAGRAKLLGTVAAPNLDSAKWGLGAQKQEQSYLGALPDGEGVLGSGGRRGDDAHVAAARLLARRPQAQGQEQELKLHSRIFTAH